MRGAARAASRLCATNPNRIELDFVRVGFALDVSGAKLADGASEAPIRLPPSSSTLVPIAVMMTDLNLGQQPLAILTTGSISYRLDGAVTLAALPIPIPFSRTGDLSVLGAGLQVAAANSLPT